jgi:hypothetical protein
LDGGQNPGGQLDPPVGGCEDGAVVVTEGDRTPLGRSAVILCISPNLSFAPSACSIVAEGSDRPVLDDDSIVSLAGRASPITAIGGSPVADPLQIQVQGDQDAFGTC